MANQLENNILDISENIEEITSGEVTAVKKLNLQWLSLIAAGGLMLGMVNCSDNSTMQMTLLTLGIGFLCVGIIKVFVKQWHYYHNGEELKLYEIDFDSSKYNDVISLYEKDNFAKLRLIYGQSTSIMKIKFLCNSNFTTAYGQVFNFVPFNFVAITHTRLIENNLDDLKKLITNR